MLGHTISLSGLFTYTKFSVWAGWYKTSCSPWMSDITDYPPYWRPFLLLKPEEAPCCGDRDPLIMTLWHLLILNYASCNCYWAARKQIGENNWSIKAVVLSDQTSRLLVLDHLWQITLSWFWLCKCEDASVCDAFL